MNDKKSLYGLFTYKPESKYENNNYKWFFKLIAEMLCSEDIKFKKMRQEYDKFLWYMEHEKKYRNDEKKKYVLETAQRRMEKFRKDLLENLTYDRDSINTFQQQELYLAFKSVFASRKGWDELFHFYITNIEGKPNDKHSDSDRGIRFWNNSYGALCKQEISDAVNAIIEDIKDTINRYIDILHGKNALINCFLFPLENMLKDIENLKNNQSKKMDAVSAQSHEIAKLIYPREYAFGSEKRFVDKRLTEISTLYASVFTEALVLCLLFGGIDAFGNHQFIDNYVENRLGSAETIDFEISGENGIIFSLNKFNKEGKKIDISKPQIYILSAPGGMGKSYSFKMISLLLNDSKYIDLNTSDIIELYKNEKDGSKRHESKLIGFKEKILLFDSLNEVMMSNRKAYNYICDDLKDKELKDKVIIVATRYAADVHKSLTGVFEPCHLKVSISNEMASELADNLKLEGELRKITSYPLYYKLGMMLLDTDASRAEQEIGLEDENPIKSKFDFFCRYLKRLCKPYREVQEFLFMNMFVLPRMAGDKKDHDDKLDTLKDRVKRYVTASTKRDALNDDSGKVYFLNNYAQNYINTVLTIIGEEKTRCPSSISMPAIMELQFHRKLLKIDKESGEYKFFHEVLYYFLAALDYVVRFKLLVKYALSGSLREHRDAVLGAGENGLLINNNNTDIDSFLFEYFEYDPEKEFEDFFDRITNNICKEIMTSNEGKDEKRAFGVLSVLETSVEFAVSLSHLKKLKTFTCKAVRKYCDTGLEILKDTDILGRHPEYLEDKRFFSILEGLLERDLEEYRRFRYDQFNEHCEKFSGVYKPMKKKESDVIRNQFYKYDQVTLQDRYSRLLLKSSFEELNKLSGQEENDAVTDSLILEIIGLKKDIDGLMNGLSNTFYEMSCNLIAVMTAYPNLSLLSLGYKRDVRKAFVIVADMIKKSERKGTFLQYTYVLAYRLLLFDVKIKDNYIENDSRYIGVNDLEIREHCISTNEKGTIHYLEKLRKMCEGLDFDSLLSMQLIEDYLLGRTNDWKVDRKEKLFERLDLQSSGYLPYMTLKYCVIKNKKGYGKFDLVRKETLVEKIDADLKGMLKPENLIQMVSFEDTNCMYNIMFSLKMFRKLKLHINGTDDEEKVLTVDSDSFKERFLRLADTKADAANNMISDITALFSEG